MRFTLVEGEEFSPTRRQLRPNNKLPCGHFLFIRSRSQSIGAVIPVSPADQTENHQKFLTLFFSGCAPTSVQYSDIHVGEVQDHYNGESIDVRPAFVGECEGQDFHFV